MNKLPLRRCDILVKCDEVLVPDRASALHAREVRVHLVELLRETGTMLIHSCGVPDASSKVPCRGCEVPSHTCDIVVHRCKLLCRRSTLLIRQCTLLSRRCTLVVRRCGLLVHPCNMLVHRRKPVIPLVQIAELIVQPPIHSGEQPRQERAVVRRPGAIRFALERNFPAEATFGRLLSSVIHSAPRLPRGSGRPRALTEE